MGAALQRMFASFYTRQLEVVLVGLENSGKTTLMNGKCEFVRSHLSLLDRTRNQE